MQFLLLHGSFVSWEYYWLSWLKEELVRDSHEVFTPNFPVDTWEFAEKNGVNALTKQSLSSWSDYFATNFVNKLNPNRLGIIGHSLGPLFWLHIAARYHLSIQLGIFIAPFYQALKKEPLIEKVNQTFYKTDFDWSKIKLQIPKSYVIYSHQDPYVPPKYCLNFANKLNSQTIDFKRPTHFGRDHQTFPLILELCQTILE